MRQSLIESLNALSQELTTLKNTAEQQYELVIPKNNIFVPHAIANHATIVYNNGEFLVCLEGEVHKINKENIRGLPQNMTQTQLTRMMDSIHFSLSKVGENFALTAQGRLLGGGKAKELWKLAKKGWKKAEDINTKYHVLKDLKEMGEEAIHVGEKAFKASKPALKKGYQFLKPGLQAVGQGPVW